MQQQGHKILIVDDEPDIIEFVKYNLDNEGFQTFTANNGKEAIKMAEKIKPDLILLDIMMPDLDGVEVCRELRRRPEFDTTIIAFLTARTEDYSQIAGFDVGGDDYIHKPIRPKVLISRISALLRRKTDGVVLAESTENILIVSDLQIDADQFLVIRNGQNIILPKKEFHLLQLLASKPGKVFTRDEIFKKIWGETIIVGNRTIDVHIRKIREKLEKDYISTIKGIGYKFDL
jgi:two-component system, OmpR family, alkaline phosphatase synthesis response regulator PhoP